MKKKLLAAALFAATGSWAQGTDSSKAAMAATENAPIAAAASDSAKQGAAMPPADSSKQTALKEDDEAAKAHPPSTGTNPGEALAHLKGQLDGLNESYLETKSIADRLNKIKVSGYVQAQWQLADSAGVPSVAGGNFPFSIANWHKGVASEPDDSLRYLDTLTSRQRFQIRRARLKTTYEGGTSKFVVEVDILPNGVGIKDANVTVIEPWLKTFTATMGIMDRPFGFEVPYSSSSLESPERTRMAQVVFPGEKDLGAKIEINPPERMGFLQYLNFKGGIFTGTGGTSAAFAEVDKKVDFAGRAGFQVPFYALNLEVDGGFSAYLGQMANRNDTAYVMGDSSVANIVTKDTIVDTIWTKGAAWSLGNKGKWFDRKLFGVDVQIYYDIPLLGGTSLRGEYLWGEMPGTLSSNAPYTVTAFPLASLFERKVEGWYLMLVQNIGKMFQAVVKYDVFDPNTEATGVDIFRITPVEPIPPSSLNGGPAHLLSIADLKYSTLGIGLNYYWDENLRFTAYYDMVTNEKVNPANADTLFQSIGGQLAPTNPLGHYRGNLKDNVFTFRAQVKF